MWVGGKMTRTGNEPASESIGFLEEKARAVFTAGMFNEWPVATPMLACGRRLKELLAAGADTNIALWVMANGDTTEQVPKG